MRVWSKLNFAAEIRGIGVDSHIGVYCHSRVGSWAKNLKGRANTLVLWGLDVGACPSYSSLPFLPFLPFFPPSVDPFTKKDWYDVKAPAMFAVRNIGKTLVTRTQGKSEFLFFWYFKWTLDSPCIKESAKGQSSVSTWVLQECGSGLQMECDHFYLSSLRTGKWRS